MVPSMYMPNRVTLGDLNLVPLWFLHMHLLGMKESGKAHIAPHYRWYVMPLGPLIYN